MIGVDRKILAVAMVLIVVEHLIETDDLVGFEFVIVSWLLQDDHCAIAVVVIVVVGRTTVVNSILVDFHDLCDKPNEKTKTTTTKFIIISMYNFHLNI